MGSTCRKPCGTEGWGIVPKAGLMGRGPSPRLGFRLSEGVVAAHWTAEQPPGLPRTAGLQLLGCRKSSSGAQDPCRKATAIQDVGTWAPWWQPSWWQVAVAGGHFPEEMGYQYSRRWGAYGVLIRRAMSLGGLWQTSAGVCQRPRVHGVCVERVVGRWH